MAKTPEQEKLETLKELRKEFSAYRKEYESLSGKKMPDPFPNESLQQLIKRLGGVDNALAAMSSQVRFVNKEINALDTSFDGVKSILRDINRELDIQEDNLKKTKQSYGKIRGVVGELEYVTADITEYTKEDLRNLAKKNKRAFTGLRIKKEELKAEIDREKGSLTYAQIRAGFGGKELKQKLELLGLAEDELALEERINANIEQQLGRIDNINSAFGPLSKSLLGVGGLLGKLGFDKFAGVFKDAEEKMKGVAAEVTNAGKNAKGLLGSFKVLTAGLKTVFGKAGLLALGASLIGAAVKQFNHVDHVVSNVGKTLGLNNQEAVRFTANLKSASGAAESSLVNFDRVAEAQLQINEAMGTRVQLGKDELINSTFLAQAVGLQGDELANAYKSSVLLGVSQEEMYDTVVASNDTIFSSLDLFKEAAGVTGQIAANLGNNPATIAKAVGQAKRLGINLETARDMAAGSLDFESSLAAEMEAQVLTGKALNFNRARELAFQNDIVGAAEEMLTQVGSLESFQNQNYLAQQSMADAVGLTVDQLADQLKEAELNRQISARAAKEGLTFEEARLKQLDENRTLGETIKDIFTKIGDILGGVMMKPLKLIRGLLYDTGNTTDAIATYFKDVASSIGEAVKPALGLSSSTGDVKKQLASVVPDAKNLGRAIGNAVKFAINLGKTVKDFFASEAFEKVSGFLTSKGGKITLGVAGVATAIGAGLEKMRGTEALPMVVTFGKSAGNMLANFLNPKTKGPKTTSTLSKVGSTISGGIKNLGAKLGSVMMKIPGADAVAKGAGAVMKGGKNVIGKIAGSGLAKGLGKVATKGFLKRIPILGSLVGVGYAVKRLTEGDYAGAAMEAGSAGLGLLDLVAPGVGTGLSLAADTAIAARDAGAFGGSQPTPLATGGIVQKPTNTLIGEAGAEAVIPLNEFYAKMDELIKVVSQGGNVMLDGVKVGNTLSMASYKL